MHLNITHAKILLKKYTYPEQIFTSSSPYRLFQCDSAEKTSSGGDVLETV